MPILDTAMAHAIQLIPRAVVQRISRRYIAGSSLEEALGVVARLNAAGFGVTLDVLGESAGSAMEADAMADAYAAAVGAIGARGLDAELSIKPTALDLAADPHGCKDRIRRILDMAATNEIRSCLDMEDTRYAQGEIDLAGRLRQRHPSLGLAVQAYLKRTGADLESLLEGGCRLRVCKGIYAEDDAHLVAGAGRDRAAINPHFLAHVRRCFEAGVYVSVATHDTALIEAVVALTRELDIRPAAFEFQMLLGVCEPLRDRLRAEGFPVRVYVPFGHDWYGYSARRLKENPRIAGYVFRAMLGA